MMFGESLLMENSVDPFGGHGAGSKLGRASQIQEIIPEEDKKESDPIIEKGPPPKTAKEPPKIQDLRVST